MPFKPFIYVNLPVPTFWGAFFSTKISNHANAPPRNQTSQISQAKSKKSPIKKSHLSRFPQFLHSLTGHLDLLHALWCRIQTHRNGISASVPLGFRETPPTEIDHENLQRKCFVVTKGTKPQLMLFEKKCPTTWKTIGMKS